MNPHRVRGEKDGNWRESMLRYCSLLCVAKMSQKPWISQVSQVIQELDLYVQCGDDGLRCFDARSGYTGERVGIVLAHIESQEELKLLSVLFQRFCVDLEEEVESRRVLSGWLQRERAPVWLFGSESGRGILSMQTGEGLAIVVRMPSLREVMRSPAVKRELWGYFMNIFLNQK